ncbi:MAG: hypothetical protein MHPSP_002418, partial [Paramarteilia canceri]
NQCSNNGPIIRRNGYDVQITVYQLKEIMIFVGFALLYALYKINRNVTKNYSFRNRVVNNLNILEYISRY